MPRLDSSAIRRVTYNPKTQKMNVQFVGTGKQYTYVGVPEDVYDDFVNSSSAGKFFNDNIKDDYIAVPSEFVGSVRFDSPDDEDFYEERNMSGKELKETKTDAELVDIFKKQKAYTEFLRRQEALNRIKERGRLPRDPDIIDPTFRKPTPQSFSRITGEDMSVSKDVLREFQAREGGAGVGGAFRTGGLRPGTSVGAGRVPIANKNKNIRMGLEYLYKNLGGVAGVMGKPPQTHDPVPGFRQPSTGGPNRGGRGPRQPDTGGSGGSGGRPIVKDAIELFGSFNRMLKSLALVLGVGGLGSVIAWSLGAGRRVVERANEETNKIIDNAFFLSEGAKETLKNNKAILIAFLVLAGGSAELLRRSMPKIKKVLTNRRIAAEIEEALDAGDEDLARTILFDAIEDEGINLSGLRRRLSPSDYQKLYRDM